MAENKGKRLKMWALEHNMVGTELAAKLGISKLTLYAYYANKRYPSTAVREKMRELGIDFYN